MKIDESNIYTGISIKMHAVFFYYRLIEERGFSTGQTVYWLMEGYTCWDLINIKVDDLLGHQYDVDGTFIKEAATVYLLCMLDEYYFEFEESEWPKSDDKIMKVLGSDVDDVIPEAKELVEYLLSTSKDIDFKIHSQMMNNIYDKYVCGKFKKLLNDGNLTND